MCIAFPARVVAVDETGATVDQAGRRRRASLLLVPDAAPGDWVIVASGAVLRRLAPAEAQELIDTLTAATTAADAATASGAGGPS
jgi:hydrogenase expression/formation protein HypC